jgi:hypothetical protein
VRGYAKRGKHRTEATEVTEGEIGWAVEDCFGARRLSGGKERLATPTPSAGLSCGSYAKRGKHRTEVTEGEIGWAVEDCFGELGGPLKTVLVNTATSGAAKREIIDAFLLAYFARRPTVSPGKKFPSPSVTSVTSVRCLPLSRDSRTQVNDAFSSLFAASLVHPHSVTSELLNS